MISILSSLYGSSTCIQLLYILPFSVQVGGPVPLAKLEGETNVIEKTKPEKVIGNLLPKRHNNDPRRRPPSPANANVFIDKPDDVFIIPEPQRKKRPIQTPRVLVEVHSDDSSSPSPLPVKHPRKKPMASSVSGATNQLSKVPKTKSQERGKTVRFDASIPPEEEPPPLPVRGIPASTYHTPSFLPKVIDTRVPSQINPSDEDSSDVTDSTELTSENDSQRPLMDTTSSSSDTMSVESESS